MVHEAIYDKFLPLFVKTVNAPQVGDPLDPKTFQGAQVSKTQVSSRTLERRHQS